MGSATLVLFNTVTPAKRSASRAIMQRFSVAEGAIWVPALRRCDGLAGMTAERCV